MQVHLAHVSDPDFGTIAATVDENGDVLAIDAASPLRETNLVPYLEAVDECVRELAHQYAEANPGHAAWITRMLEAYADDGDD